MAVCQTEHLGLVEYDDTSVVEFREGIPAFPDAIQFVLIELPSMTPLIYLQCLSDPKLCFLTVPAICLDSSYRLTVGEEELREIGGGEEHLILAILTASDHAPPTANMVAPVVIHRGTRRGKQMIQLEGGYSFAHILESPSLEGAC